jgi:hypothetical protein
MNDVRLHVAPGNGVLVRRSTELLFVPVDDAALVDVFAAAPPARGLEAVTAHAEEHGFAVGHFCVVDWTDRIRLALFGDIEVTSDHRSMPRLSASASGTWIERTLRAEVVRVEVAADHVDPVTDLRLGTITAGGFSLTAVAGADPDDLEPPRSIAPRTPTTIRSTPAAHELVERIDESRPAGASGRPDPGDARVGPDGEGLDGGARDSGPPAPPGRRRAETVAESLLGTGPDFDAVAGRDDPTIDVPPLDPVDPADPVDAAPAGTVPWRLRFDDGDVIEVDRALVIGRRAELAPDDPRPARAVRFDCQQMSGRHLLVTPGDDEIRFTDLGSRNRSWVVTSGDQQLVALEPLVPTALGPGTHVQIGSKLFVVERNEDAS